MGGGVADSGEGLRLDLEVESGSETNGAEHAKLVFGEAEGGVADGAEDLGGEVVAAVYVVEGGGCGVAGLFEDGGVEEHAVDGEVAAEDVFAGVGGEADGVGAAAVGVGSVVAEGGDFGGDGVVVVVWFTDEDYAKVGAYGEGFLVGEEVEDDVGCGAGGYVEVLWFEVEEDVAYAASGEECLMACGAENLDDVVCGCVVRVLLEVAGHACLL